MKNAGLFRTKYSCSIVEAYSQCRKEAWAKGLPLESDSYIPTLKATFSNTVRQVTNLTTISQEFLS